MANHPWLIIAIALPLAGAALGYALGRKKARRALVCMLLSSVAALFALSALLWQAAHGLYGAFTAEAFCAAGVAFYADGFRVLFAWLSALLWCAVSVYSFSDHSLQKNLPRFVFFSQLTFSAVLGVFLSDQLPTTIVCFEVMSLASYPWVAHRETPEALRAAQSTLWYTVIGGMCMLMGLLLLPQDMLMARYSQGFPVLGPDVTKRLLLPCVLLLIGFAAKAGAFPLHTWLPGAYAAAPAPAAGLLSAVLSKAGIFGILLLSGRWMRGVAAWHILVFWTGVVTMVAGGLRALLAGDMLRVLACSSMSQIGFMLLGAGLYGLLPANGVAAQGVVTHMVNHSALKLLLFLCAGALLSGAGETGLNAIRGLGRGRRVLHFAFLTGMLGLAGVPLFSGYGSKALLHESLAEYIRLQPQGAWLYTAADWLFVLSGGLTLAYMLKLYICLFWENPARSAAVPKLRLTPGAGLVIGGMAVSVWLFGLFPAVFLRGAGTLGDAFMRTEAEAFSFFSMDNLMGAAKSIAVGLIVYIAVVRGLLSVPAEGGRGYRALRLERFGLEERVYRPLLRGLTQGVCAVSWAVSSLPELCVAAFRRGLLAVRAWRVPMPGGNRLTFAAGEFLNVIVFLLNRSVLKRHPSSIDFSCVLAAGNEELNRSVKRLKRSLSFSLLLFCVGLFALLTYLVLW